MKLLPCTTALLALCLAACGGGTTPIVVPGPNPPTLDPGTGEAVVTVGFDGKLLVDFELTTTTGVRFFAAAGTCLSTLTGQRIVGSVPIGIDDGGGPGVFPGGAALFATARLYALLGPAGLEVPTHVRFEPPARVEVDFGPLPTGGIALNTWVRDEEIITGGPPGIGGGAAGSAVRPIGMADIQDEDGGTWLPAPQTGPLGLQWVETMPDVVPLSVRQTVPATVHELELPGTAADTEPTVKAWKLINPDTAEIVAVFNVEHPGMTNGDGQIRQTGSDFIAANVITRDGKRYLQVRTSYKNNFVVRALLCDVDQPVEVTSDGGSDDEEDTGGEYLGVIVLQLCGWGGFLDYVEAYETIEATFPGNLVVGRWFLKPGIGDKWFARVEIHDRSESVQTLGALLPPGWTFTYKNRRADVEIPCPTPKLVSTTADALPVVGGAGIHVADVDDLQPDDTIPLGPIVPLDIVVNGGATQAAATSPGQLHVLDLLTPGTSDVPMPGLLGAVALSHTEDTVFTALSTGHFVVVDVETKLTCWSIPTLPPASYTSMARSPDGAFAYCGSNTGLVVPIDIIRRQALTPILVAADSINVSPDGMQMVAVDSAGGGIRRISLATGTVGPLIATGTQPVHALYGPLGLFLCVANFGGSSVSVFHALAPNAPTTLNTGNGPNCLAHTYDPITGTKWYVVCFGDTTMQEFVVEPTPAVTNTQAVPPLPTVVRANGQ